jgi:O-acetylhomoserine (thiol)-lyase
VTGARATPIHQTTSFVFDNAEHASSLFNLQTFGNVYSRISNPTVAVFEERIASLENGRAALACASGMAAQMTALLAILKAGDHIVAASTLYGGTVGQLGVGFSRLGIETTFVDPADPDNFARAMRPNTRAVYGETIGNPLVNVLDIAAVAEVAHAHGVPLVIDNTVASPYLCNPCDLGADIVVHSATKYLGGHGTTMGGVVVEGGKFPWDNGKFPEMVEPSRAYHGVKFYETFGDFGYTMKARMEVNRTFGAVLSPMSAWQLLQGTETLHLRMREHCRNALKVATVPAAAPRRCVGQLPGPAGLAVFRAGARNSSARWTASRGLGHPDLRHRGGCRSGREVHRRLRVPEPPGQHRRRQDAGDPPCVDHAPPAQRRGTEKGRRERRHGAPVGGHRGRGRHPVGHRPGAGRATRA